MSDNTIDLKSITEQTRSFATHALQQHQLNYPNEHLARFLSRFFGGDQASASPLQGLDIGYGSGQHLKLMMDYGLQAHGIELIPEAAEAVQTRLGTHPLLGKLWQGDFATLPLPREAYNAIICWGMVFLKPLDAMLDDLKLMATLLHKEGLLCLNFRTPDTWFYGLGQELFPQHYLLDERAREYAQAHYTFLNADQTRQLIQEAGFEILNFERYDWWKNNQQDRHSWWIVWAKKSASA